VRKGELSRARQQSGSGRAPYPPRRQDPIDGERFGGRIMGATAERARGTATEAASRKVVRIVEGERASDGAGVKLTRVIGTPALPDLDPFLMLDEFRSDDAADYIAGFPDHPHRGFETVTYMLAGRMRHRDNQGNSGLLKSGGAQWMTAGR